MTFDTLTIYSLDYIFADTFLLKVEPSRNTHIKPFKPGQYAIIKSPQYLPDEEHTFSIASSPVANDHLEFCIKVYGDWTKKLSSAKPGDQLNISYPHGSFTWEKSDTNIVFLVGGIGISPLMSMLRTIEYADTSNQVTITVLYGNRTPDTVMYKNEIESIVKKRGKVVHIFSHITPDDSWQGYRGFITSEIIAKEVALETHPTFFMIGPPIFLEKMKSTLNDLKVAESQIKQETI